MGFLLIELDVFEMWEWLIVRWLDDLERMLLNFYRDGEIYCGVMFLWFEGFLMIFYVV
jgi:hypothetical protein